jgi:hypothetical protein
MVLAGIGLFRIDGRGSFLFRTRDRNPSRVVVSLYLQFGRNCQLTRRSPSHGIVVRVLPSHSLVLFAATRLFSTSADATPFCSIMVGRVDPRGGSVREKFGTLNLKPCELRGLSGTLSGLDTREWGALLAGDADLLLLSTGGERSEAGSRLRRGDASVEEREELLLNDQLCRFDFPRPAPRDDDRCGFSAGPTIKSRADRRLAGLPASMAIGSGDSRGRTV